MVETANPTVAAGDDIGWEQKTAYQQWAESLGIPTGAVAVALHKARGKLETLFVTEEQVR